MQMVRESEIENVGAGDVAVLCAERSAQVEIDEAVEDAPDRDGVVAAGVGVGGDRCSVQLRKIDTERAAGCTQGRAGGLFRDARMHGVLVGVRMGEGVADVGVHGGLDTRQSGLIHYRGRWCRYCGRWCRYRGRRCRFVRRSGHRLTHRLQGLRRNLREQRLPVRKVPVQRAVRHAQSVPELPQRQRIGPVRFDERFSRRERFFAQVPVMVRFARRCLGHRENLRRSATTL